VVQLPLAAWCGYIRKQVSVIDGSTVATRIDLTGMPGGAGAFELVTKFCYGESLEITEDNVALLRCAAEHLEMTDDSKGLNLAGRAEAYLEGVALMSLAGAVTVLRKSEELLPVAEEVDLVGRCVGAIAHITCSNSQFSAALGSTAGGYSSASVSKAVDAWWADELTSLRIDTFQRVLIAMKARGFKGIALGTLIMLYAQKSLRRLVTYSEFLHYYSQIEYLTVLALFIIRHCRAFCRTCMAGTRRRWTRGKSTRSGWSSRRS
jgi:hypothetical protein